MVIRPADPDRDARGIARVHVASWQASYRGLLPDGYLDRLRVPDLTARWHRRISAPAGAGMGRPNIRVLEEEGRVAGFALIGPCLDDESLMGFAGEVSMLYVHPARTGHGLGRALLDHVLDVLASRDYYWSVIWVLEDNREARAFYEHMGLRPDGARRHERFMGVDVPVVRYAQALNPVLDFAAFCRGTIGHA